MLRALSSGAALAGRIAYIVLFHSYRFRLDDDHFQFGWEMGRIGRALATGYGYADPFNGHTGPTAWVPPLYPLLIAAAFKVFGVYTLKAAFALLALNSVFSSITALLVYEIGARCFGPRNGLWAGWLWALYPAAAQYATRWVWEMTLTTLVFTAIIVLALRMRRIGESKAERGSDASGDPQSLSRWALFGLLWGLIALLNPTPLLFLPVCVLWILLGAANPMQSCKRVLVAGLIWCAVIAPWTIRNERAFHSFIPLRGNFGAELYLGDGPGSTGFLMIYDHPYQSPSSCGSIARWARCAMRLRDQMARQAIRDNPGHFLADSVKRVYFFWSGVPRLFLDHPGVEAMRAFNYCFVSLAGLLGLALALRRHKPAAGLFAWAFLLLPLTYYFVTVHARFRHPLEPLICILGVYLFQSVKPHRPGWLGGSAEASN